MDETVVSALAWIRRGFAMQVPKQLDEEM